MLCMCTEIMSNDELDQFFKDVELDEPNLDVSSAA